MKKSVFLKTLSVLLTLILVSIPILSLSASAAEAVTMDCPEIYVHGFMASRIMIDKDDPSKGNSWDWSTEEILAVVKQALPAIARLSVTWNWDKFTDEVVSITKEFFKDATLNPDGSANGNSCVDFEYPPASSIKKNSHVSFRYDWRTDPLKSADELNDFIEYVCESSGCDKVTITCHSLGGIVTTSYIAKYGNSRIKAVCFNTTAIFGETYTGELLTGKITLNADALEAYLNYLLDGNEYENLLNGLIKMLNDVGLMDFVCKFGNRMIEKISPRVLPEVVVPLFAGMPTIWAMVPDDYVEDAKEYVFNEVYKDETVDRSGLVEKIDNYNTQVRAIKSDILNDLNNNKSISVYVISRYAYASVPITPSYKILSDGVIDTKYSSFGATTAEYDSTLDSAYLAAADPKYISPDKRVDASTCMFPDQTWLIKDLPHSPIDESMDLMIDTLLYSPGQATIDTYEQYPQYLQYNMVDESINPDLSGAAKIASFFERFRDFFKDFFKLIKNLLSGIFKK